MAALEQSRQHAERAAEQETRAVGAERTCATLRLAVTSLESAKAQLETQLEATQAEVLSERRRLPLHEQPEVREQRLIGRGRGRAGTREAKRSASEQGGLQLGEEGGDGVEGVGASHGESGAGDEAVASSGVAGGEQEEGGAEGGDGKLGRVRHARSLEEDEDVKDWRPC